LVYKSLNDLENVLLGHNVTNLAYVRFNKNT
jgi:hypothetical protein